VPQYQKITGVVEVELALITNKGKPIKTYKERTTATIEVQTLGPGTEKSFQHYSKRPDIMEAMTKTFSKLVDSIVKDKDNLLSP
jgi:S-adenosylmethionine synthetase